MEEQPTVAQALDALKAADVALSALQPWSMPWTILRALKQGRDADLLARAAIAAAKPPGP